MKTVLLALAAAAVLSGCMTIPEPPPRPADPTSACWRDIGANPAFMPLKSRMPIDIVPTKATLEMFGDRTKATAEQRTLIGQFEAARKACFDGAADFREKYQADNINDELARYSAETTRLVATLYSGEATFGEFNTRYAEAHERAVAKVRALEAANVKAAQEASDSIDAIGRSSRTSCVRRGLRTECITR